MTAQPLELAVFDPSASASGSFLNALSGGKGTLLIYNDSAYTLKFSDANGVFLRRVLAGTMDKIVICDHPIYRIQWARATDAGGNAIILNNSSQALVSLVQVDGYQPDAVIDFQAPFAMPRLTTPQPAAATPPPANGGTLFLKNSSLNCGLYLLSLPTVVFVEAFDIGLTAGWATGQKPAYIDGGATYIANSSVSYPSTITPPTSAAQGQASSTAGGNIFQIALPSAFTNYDAVFSSYAPTISYGAVTQINFTSQQTSGNPTNGLQIYNHNSATTYVYLYVAGSLVATLSGAAGMVVARVAAVTSGGTTSWYLAAAFSGTTALPALPSLPASPTVGTAAITPIAVSMTQQATSSTTQFGGGLYSVTLPPIIQINAAP